jgi:hypothetical protein
LPSWQHRLTDPFPTELPHSDGTLAAARLEGSINAAPDAAHRDSVMSRILRALRPDGSLHVHGLAGDQRCAALALPGPAAAVQYVPAVGDVLDELARAGFIDIDIEKLSPNPVFVVGGVALRELRLVAKKPARSAMARQESACCGGKPAAEQPVVLVR